MPPLMMFGALLFFAGALGFLALLFASGGWQRSRQFAVLGQMLSGKLGSTRRILSAVSLAFIGTGAILCFAGVASMDAQRATRCHDMCLTAGYAKGTIGLSVDRSPANRFVACTCTGDDQPPLEQRADAVGR